VGPSSAERLHPFKSSRPDADFVESVSPQRIRLLHGERWTRYYPLAGHTMPVSGPVPLPARPTIPIGIRK
jgi:hypothetical protein